ncbi:hypothetical protein [Nesterenkonia haasae]|uniref:hypothetical protein n=1 Tax=Nesterenkonia haasae TaxID=2587813 RepID=UPI0013908F2C|nr:hypothetical protein [Nesterenkonia haasae]
MNDSSALPPRPGTEPASQTDPDLRALVEVLASLFDDTAQKETPTPSAKTPTP